MNDDITTQMIDSKELFPKKLTKQKKEKVTDMNKEQLKKAKSTHKAEIAKIKAQRAKLKQDIKRHKMLMKQSKLAYKISKMKEAK